MGSPNEDRRFEERAKLGDYRLAAEHDHDRILYSSAFLRLAGVAQVAHVSDGSLVHNRLTHSLKVGRIAQGLAVRLAREQPDVAQQIGGINAAAAEAAALAHDIGHPPFGHVAEDELRELLLGEKVRDTEGFEGNAQSFRVVTKLSVRKSDFRGLNLCRATLNALLKYPWPRGTDSKKERKYGSYRTEQEEFDWTRKGSEPDVRSVEAEIMNWADDVAYSTHDVEDYYRAGLLPLDRLITSDFEVDQFLTGSFARWALDGINAALDHSACRNAFQRLLTILQEGFRPELRQPYSGGRLQRAAIHSVCGLLINRFFKGIKIRVPDEKSALFVDVDKDIELEITMFKELIWHYVIRNPALAGQEFAQRKIIRELFHIYQHEAAGSGHVLPRRYREHLDEVKLVAAGNPGALMQQTTRVVVDVVAEMTEHQAYETYRRLTGHSALTVLDYVRR